MDLGDSPTMRMNDLNQPGAPPIGIRPAGDIQVYGDRTLHGDPSGPITARTTSRPPALSATPDPIGLLRALRRRWPVAAAAGLTCAALVGVVAYFVVPVPKYTARALLFVSARRPKEIFETRESVVEYKTFQKTQTTLITSRTVLGAALKRPEVVGLPSVRAQEDPTDWLGDQIKVDFPNGSEILTIAMSGDGPRDLAVLANAVTDAYLGEIVDQERKERLARYERLKTLFQKYQGDLRRKRDRFREMAEAVGSNDKASVALKQQMAAQQLTHARQELLELQGELRKAQIKLRVISARNGPARVDMPVTPEAVEEAIEADPAVAQDRQRLAQIVVRLRGARRISRDPNDPVIANLEGEMARVRRGLAARRETLRPAVEKRLRESGQIDDPSGLLQAREYCDILQEQEKSLREQVAAFDQDMRSFNVKSMDFHWIEDEIALAAEAAKTVGTEVEAMNVELQAPPRIRLIERAEVPRPTDPMRRFKISGAAAMAALAMMVGGISLWEFSARRIHSAEEVSNGLGIRLVGTLPAPPRRREGPTDVWGRLVIESVDAVRTMLLHASRSASLRTVMVTSAMNGEGKTTLATHLAMSLARAGRRTVLLDCDLRCPAAHRGVDAPLSPGLCDYLRGETDVAGLIRPPVPGLPSLITAGVCDAPAIDALAHDRMHLLIEELKGRFDFVVVDSAPVLLVTDALVVSQYVDAVLFSVLREISRVPKVYAAYERLSALGVRMLGAVVVGTPPEPRTYDYHYVMRSAPADQAAAGKPET
jgi:capsular exopolysaccharide synthesis family protein